jgi:hypothetical protein
MREGLKRGGGGIFFLLLCSLFKIENEQQFKKKLFTDFFQYSLPIRSIFYL